MTSKKKIIEHKIRKLTAYLPNNRLKLLANFFAEKIVINFFIFVSILIFSILLNDSSNSSNSSNSSDSSDSSDSSNSSNSSSKPRKSKYNFKDVEEIPGIEEFKEKIKIKFYDPKVIEEYNRETKAQHEKWELEVARELGVEKEYLAEKRRKQKELKQRNEKISSFNKKLAKLNPIFKFIKSVIPKKYTSDKEVKRLLIKFINWIKEKIE